MGRIFRRLHRYMVRDTQRYANRDLGPSVGMIPGVLPVTPALIAALAGAPDTVQWALRIVGIPLSILWFLYYLGLLIWAWAQARERRYQEMRKHLSKEYRED